MMRSLSISVDKCTGCRQCEMACSFEHEGLFNPAKSRIRVFVFESEGRFVPYTCTQCDEAWCRNACPTEAIVLEHSYELSFYDRASAIYDKQKLIVDVPVNGTVTPQRVEPGTFDRAIPDMEDPK